jgi:hypothetical protein
MAAFILVTLNAIISVFARDSALRMVLLPVGFSLFAFAVFRMLSRNINTRKKENENFLRMSMPLRTRFYAWRDKAPRAQRTGKNPTFSDMRKYKYFSCTQCAQRLRVPRKKGKLLVTCSRCGNKFEIKS